MRPHGKDLDSDQACLFLHFLLFPAYIVLFGKIVFEDMLYIGLFQAYISEGNLEELVISLCFFSLE